MISNETIFGDDSEEYLDEVARAQSKVAQQLSELSQSEILPQNYGAFLGSFEPDEVVFSSAGWLHRLMQIQAWLGLQGHLQVDESDPRAVSRVLGELFSQLGEPSGFVLEDPPIPRMTLKGAEALGVRLDIAVRLQQAFIELLEENSHSRSTKAWESLWEDTRNEAAEVGGRIQANSKTWSLNKFSYFASKGLLNLTPSYQRGDVWPTSDAQRLIESILRGIPLPSIILLTPKAKNKKMPASCYEVVDGKQRLTSILRFTGKHPEALRFVGAMDEKYPGNDLLTLFKDNYRKFRVVWKRVVGDSLTDKFETEHYFPFPIKSGAKTLDEALRGKYYCEIRDINVDVGVVTETVYEVFEHTSLYLVPIIEYVEATPKQIQEVFNLYNKQGKHLNAEEIRNALFHEVDLVKLLLVAAGDNRDLSLIDSVSEESKGRLSRIGEDLANYRFGTSRYKRTKILSWLVSLLFASAEKGGVLTVRSTAKHIDLLFDQIQDDRTHFLGRSQYLEALINDIADVLRVHSSANCWFGAFQDNGKGEKWQELQLVASLLAVFLIAQTDVDVELILEENFAEILEFTKKCPRPGKAQNKTQWAFIGRAALGIVRAAGVDLASVEAGLMKRYGVCCLPTLLAAETYPVE